MVCSAHPFPCQAEREDSLRPRAAPRRAGAGGAASVAHGAWLLSGSSPWSVSCFGELDLNFEPDNETVGCFKAIP